MAASSGLVPVAKLKTGAVLSATLVALEGITTTAGEVTWTTSAEETTEFSARFSIIIATKSQNTIL